MIVQCPACNARYRIRDSNIPPSGGKIRCPSCGHSFIVYPEAAPEVVEDRTSITSQGALNQLVSSMESRQQLPDDADLATEMVSGADLDKLRQFQNLDDMNDDGTLEIKNPMEFWQQLQAETGSAPPDDLGATIQGATIPDGVAVPADDGEYDAAPTEIVSADSAALASFVAKPSLPTPSLPTPSSSGMPTPAFPGSAPPSLPTPNLPPPKPSLPTPGMPSLPNASQSNQFQQTPAPAAPNTGPFGGIPPQQPQQVPVGSPHQQVHDPFSAPNADPFGPGIGGSPSSSTDDILAAIEEVSQAHLDEPSSAVAQSGDPNHDGPWKLKTNFGLTYEFPDTRSLKGWLSSRDELVGYTVSADDDMFLELSGFPQLNVSAGPGPSQMVASSGLYGQPSSLPAAPDEPAPAFSAPSQPFASSGFSSSSGQFQAQAPLPQNPVPVQNEYRPPSQAAKWNKVLWAVFVVLLLACAATAIQTFEVFDIWGAITGQPTKINTAPKPQPKDPVAAPLVDAPDQDSADESEEVEALLKKARRDERNTKLPDALDTLERVELLDPDRLELWQLRKKIYDSMGKTDDADAAQAKVEALEAAMQPAGGPDAGTDSGSEGERGDSN